MILVFKYLVPKGYSGMVIFPFIILKNKGLKNKKVFVNHEKIHLRQQLELLVFPFYILYMFEFLIRLCQYTSWNLAYRNISFEREAYANETNLAYLKERLLWQFLKYLRKNDVSAK